MSWKLNWIKKEAFAFSDYKNHRKQLNIPLKFYLAIILKAIRGFWKKPIRFQLRNGGSFKVFDFMTLYIYKEIFIDGCYDWVELPQNSTILDIGANTGLFSIRMKQQYPDSKIYCFEPLQSNVKQLRDNINGSDFKNVTIIAEGVGGATRTEKLFIHKHNIGGHSIIQSETQGSLDFEQISILSINDAFKTLRIERCSLLKLDCEGAEYEIIKSIDHNLAGAIDKIIFEPCRSLYDVEELNRHLLNLGFIVEDRGICYAYKQQVANA
jgi:FkbM family methyltransferase